MELGTEFLTDHRKRNILSILMPSVSGFSIWAATDSLFWGAFTIISLIVGLIFVAYIEAYREIILLEKRGKNVVDGIIKDGVVKGSEKHVKTLKRRLITPVIYFSRCSLLWHCGV